MLVDDVAAVERVASEMVEDAHNNGVKYLEVRRRGALAFFVGSEMYKYDGGI